MSKVAREQGVNDESYFTPTVSQQMIRTKSSNFSHPVRVMASSGNAFGIVLPLEMSMKMETLNNLKQLALASLPPPIVRYEVVLKFPVSEFFTFLQW